MAFTIAPREVLATLGDTAVAWPLAALAQQVEPTRRIGMFSRMPRMIHKLRIGPLLPSKGSRSRMGSGAQPAD
jgi:hypothetical protein